MRDHGAEKRRPSQGEQFGTCNWDRAHVPPEVIRPRIGRHEDCRERQPCQCRHGYGPYASAHRVCHGSREAPSARPAPLASVLLFLDTGCQGGLKRISRERVRPLRGRSAHVALAVSEGQTTLRGCGGRGAAWPLTASEGQGLDPLETASRTQTNSLLTQRKHRVQHVELPSLLSLSLLGEVLFLGRRLHEQHDYRRRTARGT